MFGVQSNGIPFYLFPFDVLNYHVLILQNKGRLYEVNGCLVSIPNDIINKIRAWNTDKLRNDSNYDIKIVHALLVLCIGSDGIAAGNISDKVMKFVKGKIRNHDALTQFIYLIYLIHRVLARSRSQ